MGAGASADLPETVDLTLFKSLSGVYFRQEVFDMYQVEGSIPKAKMTELQALLKAFVSKPMAGEGETIPTDVVLKCRIRDPASEGPNPFDWKDVVSGDLFKGKRIVMFSLPGAFTPVCSSMQVPGYLEKYDELLAAGADDVYCISVNDAFVMRQWGLSFPGMEEEQDPASGATCALNPGNFKKVCMQVGAYIVMQTYMHVEFRRFKSFNEWHWT